MLSFLTGGDVYDPDRVAADRELLRLYYRSKGYADASVPSAVAEYDPATKGFTLTFSIDEGPLYHFGDISVDCHVAGLDPGQTSPPAADPDRRDVRRQRARQEHRQLSRPNWPSSAIPLHRLRPAPRATPTRGASASRWRSIRGPRTYVERIEIHGNTRTRGYVIRREFDYCRRRCLQQGADRPRRTAAEEPELFQDREDLEQAGLGAGPRHARCRAWRNNRTGDFNIAGGYSTTDGLLAEVKLGDSNFLGTGAAVKTSVDLWPIRPGRRPLGIGALFSRHPASGGDRVSSPSRPTPAATNPMAATIYGATMSLGTPMTEQVGVQWRYSISRQNVTLDPASLAAPPSLPIQQAAAGRPAMGFRRRRHRQLQHARQYQESDQRLQFATQAGSRRPRRRREFPAYHRGRALLSVAQQRPRRHGPRPGRLHHRLWRPAGAADRQLLRRPARWCADLRPTASGRAISRPAPPWIMSAAACTGRRRRNCRAPSPACRRNTA